jgi:hypothetical protein
MALRASKPSFNVREKLTELGRRFGLKGSELVEAETVQEARDLVSAGRKNLIYNGSMIINQRGNATGKTASANYGIDRFFTQMENSVSGTWSIGQSTDVPAGYGFKFSLEYGCTTTSSNANRYLMTIYRMEGFDSQVFRYGTPYAKDVTLSFWIKCSKSGNIQVNFENEDNPDAGYQTKQTIHKSGTWEKKVVTIPGDTTKAFAWTNAKAMCFDIVYSAFGSAYNGGTPTAEWSTLSNNQRGTHCNIDLFNSASDYVKITGVQLELGKNATEFEHRPYGEELALCQRYFQKIGKEGHAGLGKNDYIASGFVDASGGAFYGGANLKVTMRTSPTISINGTASHLGYTHPGVAFVATGLNNYWSDPQSYVINLGGTGSGTTGFGAYARITNNATQLDFNAEI